MKQNNSPTPQNSDKRAITRHVSPKCGSEKTVASRLQGNDKWIVRLLARSPYRCLRCYHRFWKTEPFFANKSRILLWAALLVVVFVFVLIKIKPDASPAVDQAFPYDFEPPVVKNVTNSDTASSSQQSEFTVDGDDKNSNPVADINRSFEQSSLSDARLRESIKREKALSPKQWSPEQLEQQIELAKQQAELAKQDNLKRQRRLKQSLNTVENELQSLLKLDISYEIDQWKQAWEAGDTARYLSFYSKAFVPASGVSQQVWKTKRQQRVTPSKKASLKMSDFNVSFSDNNTQSAVNFKQDYQSDSYSDTVRKQLILRKEGQRWKIIAENEIYE